MDLFFLCPFMGHNIAKKKKKEKRIIYNNKSQKDELRYDARIYIKKKKKNKNQ